MLKDNLVVLTEEEYEALQDSRFAELPALLVGDLRHALESATPDTRMGCLLRNLLPYLRKPQVPAEVIALVYEGIDEVRDAMAAVPLSGRMSDERQEVDRKALAGFRLAVQSFTTCVEALLEFSLLRDELGLPQPECDEEASGSDPAPTPDFAAMDPDDLSLEEVQALRDWLDKRGRRKVREEFRDGGGVAWRGELWVRDKPGHLLAQVHLQRTEPAALLALCQKIAAEEASGSAPAPKPTTPDFAAMSPDELRAWLDERGRLYEGRGSGEEVLFHAWFGGGGAVGAGSGRTREAALLALCQKVAAKEAS